MCNELWFVRVCTIIWNSPSEDADALVRDSRSSLRVMAVDAIKLKKKMMGRLLPATFTWCGL